jgi:transcriptional regulator with XRE-family HTH domain
LHYNRWWICPERNSRIVPSARAGGSPQGARTHPSAKLAQAARTTQRAVSYYENDDGLSPAAALIDLARALKVTADELLGLKTPKVERIDHDPETRRLWKRFQMVSTLPEKDRRAVIRLINSLVSLSAGHRSLRAAS